MRMDEMDARWHALSEEVMTGMRDWRVQHPTHRPTPAMRGTWASDLSRN